MKSILRLRIVEKYNLKKGDKISYEQLIKIEENENVSVDNLIVLLEIKRANYLRIKRNHKSKTQILLEKRND